MATKRIIRRNLLTGAWERWIPPTADKDGFWATGLFSNDESPMDLGNIRNAENFLLSYEGAKYPEYKIESFRNLIRMSDFNEAFDTRIYELLPRPKKSFGPQIIDGDEKMKPLNVILTKKVYVELEGNDPQIRSINSFILTAIIEGGVSPYNWVWKYNSDPAEGRFQILDLQMIVDTAGIFSIEVYDSKNEFSKAGITLFSEDFYPEISSGGGIAPPSSPTTMEEISNGIEINLTEPSTSPTIRIR